MMLRLATKYLVVHCSATQANQNIDAKTIDAWHKAKGWSGIGYHYVIKRDGTLEQGRPVNQVGAHVEGYNWCSIGICLVGGANAQGKGENNFAPEQFQALRRLLGSLQLQYPRVTVLGHRDLSPDKNKDGIISKDEWLKDCPSFDVRKWLATPDQ